MPSYHLKTMSSPNKKRLIQNLVLLVLVTVLLLFITTRKEHKAELHQTLYDKNIGDQVTEIVIHAEAHEDVLLKNENGVWKVIKSPEFIADKDKIRHLFTLLSENADVSYAIEGKDLASYGLDKDRLSVSFNGVKLVFGKLNEVSQQRYILKDDKMYLITETVAGLLASGPDGFKQKDNNQ